VRENADASILCFASRLPQDYLYVRSHVREIEGSIHCSIFRKYSKASTAKLVGADAGRNRTLFVGFPFSVFDETISLEAVNVGLHWPVAKA
jgi:hypothetical protein